MGQGSTTDSTLRDFAPTDDFHTTLGVIQLVILVLGCFGNAMIIVVMRQPTLKHSTTSLYFIALSGIIYFLIINNI